MPRKVRGPDGVVHLFPDDATDAEISAVLSEGPSVMDAAPTLADRAIAAVPSIAGSAGGILGGMGGTAFGVGVGGAPGAIGGAAVGGMAGEAIKQLLDRARGVEAPGTAGQAAASIGKEGAIQGAMEAGGAAAAKYVIAPVAKGLMRGYLKPSLAGASIKDARTIVQTALDEALPVTKGGEERAGRLIADLNKQINGALAANPRKVDLHQVAEKVRAFAKAKYFKPGVADTDYQAALEVADSIDKHASLMPAGATPSRVDVSAAQANDVKQAVRPTSRAYGQQGYAPETTTRKVAGGEMRQAIEQIDPTGTIGPLNAREGRLIDAQDAVTRAAGREENRNPLFGVPTLLASTIGTEEGIRNRDPASGLFTAMAVRAALSPAVMTRGAILASKLAKNGYTAAAAARIALETVRSASEQKTQGDPGGPQ